MNASNEQQSLRPASGKSHLSSSKRWLLIGGGIICLLCWLALGIGLLMDAPRHTLIVLVTVAAVATEGFFWLAAAVLGVTAFQARRKIWRWLTRRPAENVEEN